MVPPDNSGGTPVPADTAASEPPTSGRHDGEAPRFPPIRKTRGPEPKKRSEACAAMVGAIKGRQLSIGDLAGMKQKELSKLYPGAGRTVLVEARKDALRKLGENSGKTPTNDK
jgi:hypothetical protein